MFSQDEGVRPGTTADVLGKLRPAFSVKGSVTAGNSSQTSDGAASVFLMDKEQAEAEGLKPLLKFRSFAVGGVPPEVMGIGPVAAIPKALINEDKVNVNGCAIALGHPLGCTGAKLTLSLMHEMQRRNEQFGIVTMCIGGGMGAAGVFELLA